MDRDRTVPFDLVAERAILGACLLDREVIIGVRHLVSSADFYLEKHALIYDACLSCFDDKVPPDLVMVASRLKLREQLDMVGGLMELGELQDCTPSAAHAPHYARTVAKLARSRRLIELGGQITAAAYERDPDEVEEEARQLLDLERRATNLGDDWQGQMVDGLDVWKKEHTPRPFIIESVLPIGVTILHALPKKRKSWLAKDFCYAVAGGGKAMGYLQAEKGEALYLNLEMDEELLNERLRVMYPDSPPPRGVKFFYEWPRIDSGLFTRLENYLTSRPYTKIIVIDTMVRIFPDENIAREGYRQDSRLIEKFTDFNKNRGLAILLVHHSRKGGRGGNNDPVLNSLGSVGLPGSVDSILELEIDETDTTKGRLLRGGRRIKDDSPLPLRWDVQIGRWVANPKGNELKPAHKALLQVIEKRGPITPAKIAIVMDMPPPTIRRMCQELHQTGRLVNAQGAYALPDEPQFA